MVIQIKKKLKNQKSPNKTKEQKLNQLCRQG